MARYIKANPKVAQFLRVENDQETVAKFFRQNMDGYCDGDLNRSCKKWYTNQNNSTAARKED